ncbi:universal stress protein [Streptomyces sp. NBC_01210]|uniref:universal stress protein n=1 Tax=Streptomyces sp. NBC_01210 TaxID=2903774 RepID=UPI002E1160AD|nr:universal stress protein [Streptomyces sp. NBC_01210]
MSRPVVVGVDDSDECLAAVDWAADEAAARGTGLRLVNASQWHEHQLQAVKPSRETRADQEQSLLGAMEERVRARQSGVAMATEEVEDAPARALLAAGSDADLLVLGSTGLGTVGGFIVGSVGQEVVAEAKHPVVLVRPDYGDREADAGAPGGDGRRKVVLGLDVRDVQDELLDFAFAFAARHAVPLHIVHTWHHPGLHRHAEAAGHGGPDPGTKAERESALSGAVRPYRDRFPGVKVSEEAAPGRAASHLVQAASDAGLVVVGRRAASGAHIGSVTHAVIHHARCPVAVVPHA